MENNIDKNLYNEKSLYLLNIKELRDIGRKFCVPSPTTMKKHELIDYILKVVYGEIKAPARSNYGRPNVREFEMDKYLEKIKRNSDMTDELMKLKLEDDFLIGALKVAAPKENEPKDNIETRVYAEQNGKCLLKIYQFVDSEKDIEISSEYAKNLNLEEQDVLEVRIEGDMCKIITINGVSVKNKFEEFVINSSKISAGSRKVFYVSTKEEREEKIKKIEETCENTGLKLFIFANKKYTGKCTESFVYDEVLDYPKMYKKFISMFSEWERLALQGEDVVVLLENTEDVDDMLSSFDEGVNERTKNNVKSLIDRFVSLGNVFITFRLELKVKY
ncbi:MAG: hypothetical protein IKD36_02970 [Clostridia bacterium]|nr:hypothetical protein [Clostridia bacterium]